MTTITQISRENVLKVLNWKDTVAAVQVAILSVTEKRAIQNPRTKTSIPGTTNSLLSMPAYLNDEKYHALSCKLLTTFHDNAKYNLPTALATIILFNETNGTLEAVIDGTEITLWRTAAASIIATKYMRSSNNKDDILAILGAGAQAKIHAIAFQEFFKFKEVRIWNRNYKKAKNLCDELNSKIGAEKQYVPFQIAKDCVKEADVLITTTPSRFPIVRYEWLKKNAHINAVGHNLYMMELDVDTYISSFVLVDHMAGIEHELKHLTDIGVSFKGELGALINGTLTLPESDYITIFQSLGMATEDAAMARLVYDKYKELKLAGPTSEL